MSITFYGKATVITDILQNSADAKFADINLLAHLTTLTLSGNQFEMVCPDEIEPEFRRIYPLADAIALSEAENVKFDGYPLWIKTDKPDRKMPANIKGATYFDEFEVEQQYTFAEWCANQKHTVYEYDPGNTTEVFAGNFKSYRWDLAKIIINRPNFTLLERADAISRLPVGE